MSTQTTSPNAIPSAAVLLCLGVIPVIGHLISGGAGTLAGAVLMSSALHLILFAHFDRKTGQQRIWLFATSGGALLSAIGVPFVIDGRPETPADAPFYLSLGWLVGALVARLAHSMRFIAGRQRNAGAEGLGEPRHIGLMGLVLAICFTSLSVAGHWGGGQKPSWLDGLTGVAAAAYVLASACLALHACAGMAVSRRTWSALAVFATFGVTLVLLAGGLSLPGAGPLGSQSLAFLLVLVGGLALNAISRAPVILLSFVFALLTLAWIAADFLSGTGNDLGLFWPVLAILLLVAVLVLNARFDAGKLDALSQAYQPSADHLDDLQRIGGGWLVRLDLVARRAAFPLGGMPDYADKAAVDFSELFGTSALSGVMELMSRLQSGDFERSRPVELVSTRHDRPGFTVHLLGGEGQDYWAIFVAAGREAEWRARAERNERLLSQAMLREERLLSIASHELRTPIAILSMMTEELKAGLPWSDVEVSFDKTLSRVVSMLDDLRAGSGSEGGLANASAFTLHEIAQQIVDVFGPAAVANGIALRTALSQQAQLPLKGDQGRVFIALSKLVHNAIIHSKGHEVVLNAFLAREGTTGGYIVTWQVSDDGVGIDPKDHAKILEPFSKLADDAGVRTGLGLYTAKKAINLIGGNLVLHSEGRGTRFVLTHPARAVELLETNGKDIPTMSDIQAAFPNLSVLLVEDNKLVGEITSARLTKLFGQVRWAETGTHGLELFQQQRPDLLIVDQLLPGLSGSELVREVRKVDSAVPIVGITASTMGTECQELEAAGANLALEKPLSFMQLKGIVSEYFGLLKPTDAAS